VALELKISPSLHPFWRPVFQGLINTIFSLKSLSVFAIIRRLFEQKFALSFVRALSNALCPLNSMASLRLYLHALRLTRLIHVHTQNMHVHCGSRFSTVN
jgi:hypothetical protein